MFEGNQFVFQGFEVPSDDPVFLTVLSIHVMAGLVCVIAGIISMLSKKKPGYHPKSGNIYFLSLWVVFITACIIAVARWEHVYHLFFLGLVSFLAAIIGRKALLEKWQKWPIFHITGMGISYIFLLIAFYIDNAKFLPVWKDLPHVLYWLLPPLIGIPILIKTLFRHPLSKNYFKKLNNEK
jgi:hypothetical protein